MALKTSPLTWDAPPNGGSAILDYRVMTFENGTLVTSTTVTSPSTNVTHSAMLERTVLIQARNDQGYSAPLSVTLPAVPEAGDGDGSTPELGTGLSSGAVPTGSRVDPTGLTATQLDTGVLLDVETIGSGYTGARIDYAPMSDSSNTQSIWFDDKNLWPIVLPGLENFTNYTIKVQIASDPNGPFTDIGTVTCTPTPSGTPHAMSLEASYNAADSTLTISQTIAASGTYDSEVWGYAKTGDTVGTYSSAPLPVTIAAVAGVTYSLIAYALIRNKIVAYTFTTYDTPAASGGGAAG